MPVVVGLFRSVVVVAGVAGVGVDMARSGIWPPLVYFTLQSNAILVACFAAGAYAAFRRRPGPPPAVKGAATLYILITGLVFHLVLADAPAPLPPASPGVPPVEVLPFVDTGLLMHTVTPVLAAADFLLFDRHGRLRWRHALLWLSYPLAYVAFTTVRGIVLPGSAYPYFFVDVRMVGYDGLLLNVLGYGVAFYLLGLVLIGVDRLLGARVRGGRRGVGAGQAPSAAGSASAGA
ncbi:Pr6Pr family membrane protein [Nocardiopsis mangrovi]|uniref:Pr6Pr family membrane protein n=1 Tax=Nocardiopsis mangrovi TaxID=1179818 RepID=A0ABV9E0J7_9ACTN